MEKNQTAVEWLEEKVDNMILNGGDTDLLAVIEHINQAKAMEEDQHFHTWYKSLANDRSDGTMNFTQYYKETYGSSKQMD